jgi:hypothetical protein
MTINDRSLVIDQSLTNVLRAVSPRLNGPRAQTVAVNQALRETHERLVGHDSLYAAHTAVRGPWEATVRWNRSMQTPSIDISVYRKVRI